MTAANASHDSSLLLSDEDENGLFNPSTSRTSCQELDGKLTELVHDDHQLQQGQDQRVRRLFDDLKQYLEWLPKTPLGLNARLDAEHNSQEAKARELLQYYRDRPHLLEYTMEKELPRMTYNWIDAKSGEFIQDDKTRIAILLLEASLSDDPVQPILARCANQSLLADLLQFLSTTTTSSTSTPFEKNDETGALIRTHFHMAVHTSQVDITIMPSNGTVLVKAVLDLNLPHPTYNMVTIGKVHVSAQFSPLQSLPLFHYHVESVEACLNIAQHEALLLEITRFMVDLPSFVIEDEDEEIEPLARRIRRKLSSSSEQYQHHVSNSRDVFLHRTQSAWKHMNSNAHKLLFRFPISGTSSQATLSEEDEEDTSVLHSQNEDETTTSDTIQPLHQREEKTTDEESPIGPVQTILPGSSCPCLKKEDQVIVKEENNLTLKEDGNPILNVADHEKEKDKPILNEEDSERVKGIRKENHDAAMIISKVDARERPSLPKSLIHVGATWKKQIGRRLKHTAASIHTKHRHYPEQVQRMDQQKLESFQQQRTEQHQKPLTEQLPSFQQHLMKKLNEQPMPQQLQSKVKQRSTDFLDLAPLRVCPQQSDHSVPISLPINQPQKQLPQVPTFKSSPTGGSPQTWNTMLRSRWNRVSRTAPLPIHKDNSTVQSEEWVFLPTSQEDSIATSTSVSTDGDDCSVTTTETTRTTTTTTTTNDDLASSTNRVGDETPEFVTKDTSLCTTHMGLLCHDAEVWASKTDDEDYHEDSGGSDGISDDPFCRLTLSTSEDSDSPSTSLVETNPEEDISSGGGGGAGGGDTDQAGASLMVTSSADTSHESNISPPTRSLAYSSSSSTSATPFTENRLSPNSRKGSPPSWRTTAQSGVSRARRLALKLLTQ